jgi:ubiquinone biosynthesis protein UbiJ
MSRIAVAGLAVGLGLLTAALNRAAAQDIAGVEDCTKTSGLDKRTGCLQSNVNFLQQLVTKNALDARQRLNAASSEIAALKNEVIALKSTVAGLQASLEQLKAAQKGDNRPEAKKPDLKKPDAK